MKEMIPTEKQKLIYLKWEDAHSSSGWHTKEQLNKLINYDRCMCEEIGWIVYEDKSVLILSARRMCWKDPDPTAQTAEFGLIQRIPKSWVRDRKEIEL